MFKHFKDITIPAKPNERLYKDLSMYVDDLTTLATRRNVIIEHCRKPSKHQVGVIEWIEK